LRRETYHAFMLDHAAGTLPPALRLAGDIHTELNQKGAETAALWDTLGGIFLDDSIGDDVLEHRFRRELPATEPLAVEVADILATDLDRLSWRRGIAGVRYSGAGLRHGQFMRLEPGQTTPEHGHSALEATVVLQGTLIVDGECFAVGDLVVGAPGERHQPVGGDCDTCICYVGRERRPFWRLS